MFSITIGILGSFLSAIGYIAIGIVIVALLLPELNAIIASVILTIIIMALGIAWRWVDCKLRDRFDLAHKQTFSTLWTVVSVIEVCIFAVFWIITALGILPIGVLIIDILVYMVLSVLILSRKIKKLSE